MKESLADSIITSRLLVLQSKRLMLHSVERRAKKRKVESLIRRVEELRAEADSAQDGYRQAMFQYGSPNDHDYWVIAYSRLITMGRVLTFKLREASTSMPARDRAQVSPDLEMLEGMVEEWGESMRTAMVGG